MTNVLFLGAGKRLSLAEHFLRAAALEGVPLNLFSAELFERVAIASVAKVFRAPLFDSPPAFVQFLCRIVESEKIDIVIPLMDSATVALSSVAHVLPCMCLVSSHELCYTMFDKLLADEWLKARAIPVPESKYRYPAIYKPRRGYGSRGVVVVRDEYEDTYHRKPEWYFYQPYVEGTEYTVDAYVDMDGQLISALSRQRVEVINGEVTLSVTHRHEGILDITRQVLAREPSGCGWRGPITLQFIDTKTGPVLIEINPRFGGGVPHSIQLGLDTPRWILREAMGKCVEPVDEWPDGSVMVRCLRDVYL